MSRKKLTLQKRCGNSKCDDPNCDYVIVEEYKTFSNFRKSIIRSLGVSKFAFTGFMIFLIFMGLMAITLGITMFQYNMLK